MMKYELFKEIVAERIMDFMPPIFSGFSPEIESVQKVNVKKDALILKPAECKESMALPIVYLDDMYEIFSIDEDLDELLSFVAGIFISYTGSISQEEMEVDFASKKDNVIISLINTEANEALLEDIPHIDILNMSLIFRVIMRWVGDGFDAVILNNSIMEDMGLTKQELYDIALENTRRIFPPTIERLEDDIYVVSNEGNMFGAATMVYEDFMKDVGRTVGDENFYVLPSSIHQFFAVSEKKADLEQLIMMLAEGNTNITRESDRLSNAVYSYSTSRGALRKAASYR
ncbi:MAG: DUF5688 family protein [Bacillota bacterium]|nr:DUF5688 family protein [Bacillota bacterium]